MGEGALCPPLAEGRNVTRETMASACERVENASLGQEHSHQGGTQRWQENLPLDLNFIHRRKKRAQEPRLMIQAQSWQQSLSLEPMVQN